MSQGHDRASYYRGIRAAITWLHAEALTMNDPHARLVLNNAAFHLGTSKPEFVSGNADVPGNGAGVPVKPAPDAELGPGSTNND